MTVVQCEPDSPSPRKPRQVIPQPYTKADDEPLTFTSAADINHPSPDPHPHPHHKQFISMSDVAAHNGGEGRSWTVIHGVVYDITEFCAIHPGGDIIRLAAGRDSTCLVESYHPQTSLRKIEAALKNKAKHVGHVSSPRYDDRFFKTVRSRVESYLRSQHLPYHYYEWFSMFEALLTFGLYFYATYAIIATGSYLWAAALGVLTGRMGFLMHNGNHQATSKYPIVNKFVGYFMDFVGSSHVIWGFEHQVAHHMDPNELGRDNDCEIGAPWIRMHPGIPHHWCHRFQSVSILLGMSVGFVKWYLSDIPHFFAGKVGNVKFAVTKRDYVVIITWKLIWFILHIILPVQAWGWSRALGLAAVYLVIGAHYLENIFIVNHIQSFLIPPKDIHWAPKQVLSTANWGSASVFWNLFSGGLNHQIEHHLFPSMSTYLYPYISPIVKRTCEEYGLPYANYSTFAHAWGDMIYNLHRLGNPQEKAQEPQEKPHTQ